MNRYIVVSLLAAIVLLASACQPVKLISTEEYNSPEPVNVSTFGFTDLTKRVKVSRASSAQTEDYIKQTIIFELAQKGYKLVEENPDMWIDLDIAYTSPGNNNGDRYDRYNAGPGLYRFGRYYWGNPNDPLNQDGDDRRFLDARIELTFANANKGTFLRRVVEAKMNNKPSKRAENLENAINLLLVSI